MSAILRHACTTHDVYDLRLLDKHKLFTSFYQLSELHKREDLIKRIIENLDYSMYALHQADNYV